MTVASGPDWELRIGRWQEALADVDECDALIVDAPYSDRTHAGHDAGVCDANRGADYRARVAVPTGGTGPRRSINYTAWDASDVAECVASWAPRCRGWMVSITDHVLAKHWADAMEAAERYVFAPLPLVETGSRVRLSGDGPSTWTCWIVVSRPKTRLFFQWGTLPGAYVDTSERKPVVGGKPLGLMRAIVRDYTRPGDLIVDPCAGGATTLVAARMEGRRSIGAEMMQEHYEIGRRRLAHLPVGTERQPSLFDGDA